MQYAIASDASIMRASYRIKYLISATLSDFKNLITISDWTTIWLQQLNNNIRYRQQHLHSGTVAIISCSKNNNHLRNLWPISPTDLYVFVQLKYNSSMSIANIQTSNTIINRLSNKHNSAATNVSRCQSRLNVVTRMPCSLLSPRRNLI